MRFSAMKLTSVAAVVGAGALGLSMIGNGVGANFVKNAQGTTNVRVGNLNCQLSSTAPVQLGDDSHSATFTLNPIETSSPGSETVPLTVTNAADIPFTVNWSVKTTGNIFDSGHVSYAPVPQNVGLASGATATYNVGVTWGELSNADLQTAGSVTYTASCSDANSNVSLFTQDDGTAAWNNGAVVLGMPDNAAGASNAGIQLDNVSTTLPSGEPTFTTSNYSAGSPRWVIYFTNGDYVFGYPSNAGQTPNNWEEHGGPSGGYVPWTTVLNDFSSTTVASVSILMDTDQTSTTDTISNVVYGPTTYIN